MILAISLNNIKNLYDEKYDKGLIHQKYHPGQYPPERYLYQVKRAAFNADVMRIVFLIKFLWKERCDSI